MKKMMEQHRKFMKNNKGFSLVELIIVIAIMAVLVAVLAPQYTKYVEKSRQSTDISAADSILSACKTIAIDPETYNDASDGFIVKWNKADDAVGSAAAGTAGTVTCNEDKIQEALNSLVGSTVAYKSNDFETVTFQYYPATTGENAKDAYFSVASTATYITGAGLAPTPAPTTTTTP